MDDDALPVGLWGRKYLEALKLAQPRVYMGLLMRGELEERAIEMDDWARETFEATLTKLSTSAPQPTNIWEGIAQYQAFQRQAEEITLNAILPMSEEQQRAEAGNGGYVDEDEDERASEGRR